MTDGRLLSGIRELLALTRKHADTEAQFGPSWVHDQTLTAMETLVEMENAALSGKLVLAPGFSFRERLGASWVEVHGDIYECCERLDAER